MLFVLLLLGICEGAKIPIEFTMNGPINSDKLTFETLNPTQLSSINPRYFLYNILQIDPNAPIPLVHYQYGKPGSSYVSSSFNYYGTPLYAYEIHYNPFYPNIPSMIPTYVPQQHPLPPSTATQTTTTTTERPSTDDDDDDDNIEKLDEKLDPNLEMNFNNDESIHNDDSVVIEAVD